MDARRRFEEFLRKKGNEPSTIRSKLGLVRKWGELSAAELQRAIAGHSLSSKTKIYKALADYKEANDLDSSLEKKLSRAHSIEHNVNYMLAARAGDRGGMSWEGVLAARDQFLRKHRTSGSRAVQQQMLLVLLYTELPPLRLTDYKLLHYAPSPEACADQSKNYVVGNRLVLHRYKTAKTYGTNTVELPAGLAAALHEACAVHGLEGKPVFSIDIEYHLKKVLGCSVNMLRKLYVSDVLPTRSAEERIQIAKQMGHSLSTQVHVYQRYS